MAGQEESHVLLHGNLEVTVHEAENLPNLDRISGILSKNATSDPYVVISSGYARLASTRAIKNQACPEWEEFFDIPVAHHTDSIIFKLKDADAVGSQFIGQVVVPANQIAAGKLVSGWFNLRSSEEEGDSDAIGQNDAKSPRLRVSLSYTPVTDGSGSEKGEGERNGGKNFEVEKAYFPMRKGCSVTLYQDAHIAEEFGPSISLHGGRVYEPQRCWETTCEAILGAKHFICIGGWSLDERVQLIRGDPIHPSLRSYGIEAGEADEGGEGTQISLRATLSLGQILKHKADVEGVNVLLLVWDDKTSSGLLGNVGVMNTHDEEARRFFEDSKVKCLMASRLPAKSLPWMRQKVIGTMFSHHQKFVIVDEEVSSSSLPPGVSSAGEEGGPRRSLVGFLGGIDLCGGRYDTQRHSLFCELDSAFRDDFIQHNFKTKREWGPRQPWHDIHCRISGAAVWDMALNLHQRWLTTSRNKRLHCGETEKIFRCPFLVLPTRIETELRSGGEGWEERDGDSASLLSTLVREMGDDPTVSALPLDDPNTWNVQIFRSIDSGSVESFPTNPSDISRQNLGKERGSVVDTSILRAYVEAIRRAEKFIYIENQYFLGSSYAWEKDASNSQKAGADHVIPMEIALKIANKIRAGENFRVYVVVPMWPEGDPCGAAPQEILFWQNKTRAMMYPIIAKALKQRRNRLQEEEASAGFAEDSIGSHPRDFLSFFCLANREREEGAEDQSLSCTAPDPDSKEGRVFYSRRQVIYVHAKLMVVDDEYVIVGSANVNQRSMDGGRDSEIAMGAVQPRHTWGRRNSPPQGEVFGFRSSLWKEHLGDEAFERTNWREPWALECMKAVNESADERLRAYSGSEVVDLRGHLLSYPVNIDEEGNVGTLDGWEEFPDLGGKVMGTQGNLPNILTT